MPQPQPAMPQPAMPQSQTVAMQPMEYSAQPGMYQPQPVVVQTTPVYNANYNVAPQFVAMPETLQPQRPEHALLRSL